MYTQKGLRLFLSRRWLMVPVPLALFIGYHLTIQMMLFLPSIVAIR
jgi:hypothetical protein